MYYFERTYWVHKGVGPDQRWYVCPKQTLHKPCPVCEYQQELKDDPEANPDLIKSLTPT
jgi:hypothetical protein